MTRWAFLDVGNILLDEDPIAYHCTRLHWEAAHRLHPDLTFRELLARREAHALGGSRWPLYDAASALLDEAACDEVWSRAEREIRSRYAELSPLIPGAVALVERLAACFRLGLIANQGAECRAWLRESGLLSHFQVVALSEEVGSYKPDPALFRRALAEAGVGAERCVMIGDRLDNDVAPAAALGMAAVWVAWPDRTRKGWRPDDVEAVAFRASLQRISAQAERRYSGPPPALAVEDLAAIDPERLARLTRRH